MANLALDTVYNHYLTTYFHDNVTKYDTHKKSELRGIYNSIVKLNKESPLFLPVQSQETKEFAVGVKEGARELKNTIASLGGMEADELLNKKVAYSSNNSIAEAKYIGEGEADENEIPQFEMSVKNLATPQENYGKFLPSEGRALDPDTYSFDINIGSMSYEFQYNVNPDDTNKSVQEKLTRLINGANIGVTASVEEAFDQSALKLTSDATGVPEGRDSLFSVSDEYSSKRSGSVSALGIGEITSPSGNAVFSVNGMEHQASSNHFSIEKTYEITLNGVSQSEEDTISIGTRNDTESLAENLQKMADGFNSFMDSAAQISSDETKNDKLISEMKNIASYYKEGLDVLGLSIDDEGHMILDKNQYMENTDEKLADSLGMVKNFADALLRKSGQISLNPMQYVNRTVVAYKKPGNNFATPYITSAYSGMLFNSYC